METFKLQLKKDRFCGNALVSHWYHLINTSSLQNALLTSVVNKQQHRLWIVGNGAVDICGFNKLGIDLQQDHRNDRVDSSMAVISDLKQHMNIKQQDTI